MLHTILPPPPFQDYRRRTVAAANIFKVVPPYIHECMYVAIVVGGSIKADISCFFLFFSFALVMSSIILAPQIKQLFPCSHTPLLSLLYFWIIFHHHSPWWTHEKFLCWFSALVRCCTWRVTMHGWKVTTCALGSGLDPVGSSAGIIW
jgi:hypothetical protein